MKLDELAATLPNGFHDSKVHSVSIDYDAQIATLILDVWVGTMGDAADAESDRYRSGRLELLGLEYLAIEPPDPTYAYQEAGAVDVDLAEPDDAVAKRRPHAAHGFAGRFFVSDWNSFIHFAAADSRLTWLATEYIRGAV